MFSFDWIRWLTGSCLVMLLVVGASAQAPEPPPVSIMINGQGPFDTNNSKAPYMPGKPLVLERKSALGTYSFVIPRDNMLANLAWKTSTDCSAYAAPKGGAVSGVVFASKPGTIILRAG